MNILPIDNHPLLVSTTVDEVPDPPVPSTSPLGYGHIPLLFAEGAVQERIQGELENFSLQLFQGRGTEYHGFTGKY